MDVKEQLMMNLESDILQGEPMDICKLTNVLKSTTNLHAHMY